MEKRDYAFEPLIIIILRGRFENLFIRHFCNQEPEENKTTKYLFLQTTSSITISPITISLKEDKT
jgi:hypothetical protein